MTEAVSLKDALPEMLTIQLLAADVYVTFFKESRGEERELWRRMLEQELSHVRFVAMLLEAGADVKLRTPQGLTALQIAEECLRRQAASPPEGVEGEEPQRKNYTGVIQLLRDAESAVS